MVFWITLGIILLVFILAGIKIIYEYERGLVFTLGRFSGELSPGLKIVIPIIQSFVKVDKRTQVFDVPKQDCITHDNVSVNVDAVVYYFVQDTKKAVLSVSNFNYATLQLAQTTMRNVVGEVSLDELLSNRDEISTKIRKIIDEETDKWGIKVDSVELKHVELPETMKRIMAREAEAERERRGVIIKSKGEIEAAANLDKAAEILAKTDGSKYLRTLQTISDISQDPSQKFFFFPMEIIDMVKKK